MIRGLGEINGKVYESRGKWIIKEPIIGSQTGKIDLYSSPETPFGSIEIRNFGKYPLQIGGGKTLLPFESWNGAVEDIRTIDIDQIDFKFITTVTAVDNSGTGYTKDFVIEVNGWNIQECLCKKYC